MSSTDPLVAALREENRRLRARVSELENARGLPAAPPRGFRTGLHSFLQAVAGLAVQGYTQDGTVFYWDEGSERLYGYTASEAIGSNLLDLIIPPEMKGGVEAEISRIATGHCPPSAELFLQRKDGTRVPVFSSHAVVREEDGAPYLYCLDIDLRDREAMQEQLRSARDLAEQASNAKTLFLAVMSHELRTPLNGIIGPCELLEERLTEEEDRSLVEMAKHASEQLLALIDRVLLLSRIESGAVPLKVEALDLERFLEEVIDDQRVLAEVKNLRLEWEVDSAETILKTDRGLLAQILHNLIGNGIKFTEEGFVRVEVRSVAEGRAVEFHVRDSGPGIPPAVRDRVFESFELGDMSIARRHGGSGLGLSISLKLALILGGELRLEADGRESGSQFVLTLPREPELAGMGWRKSHLEN